MSPWLSYRAFRACLVQGLAWGLYPSMQIQPHALKNERLGWMPDPDKIFTPETKQAFGLYVRTGLIKLGPPM